MFFTRCYIFQDPQDNEDRLDREEVPGSRENPEVPAAQDPVDPEDLQESAERTDPRETREDKDHRKCSLQTTNFPNPLGQCCLEIEPEHPENCKFGMTESRKSSCMEVFHLFLRGQKMFEKTKLEVKRLQPKNDAKLVRSNFQVQQGEQ